jgi:maltooligosyltrehalose trehalohydrolase
VIATCAWTFGAVVLEGDAGVRFRLFAPAADRVELVMAGNAVAMQPLPDGWFEFTEGSARPGTRYAFRIDGAHHDVPDPASRFQPDGVNGPSEVVDTDAIVNAYESWPGRAWPELVFYEVHVGTFTPEGTYAAAILRLDALVALGITAIELMPLAQTPGAFNWGYDGALLYAPARAYGTPHELARFIREAHARGIAVFLDVVYNHFGPEGNYLHAYAPVFFTARFMTPWGPAINFTDAHVRAFFVENARYWLDIYGFDGLRLDATHMIYDDADSHILREIRIEVQTRASRRTHLVIENDHNDMRHLRSGYEAQWNDDFHHAAHVLVTGERSGYYGDYASRPAWYLGRTLTEGFGFQGEASPHRNGASRGSPSVELPLTAFVNFIQNHDQIGNRAFGERLTMLASPQAARAAAAVLLLAPSPPLLFMGEEWDASTPFLFFCDFEPDLARAVTEGRRREFAHALQPIPNASSRQTFEQSILDWDERGTEPHRTMLEHYRALLRIRASEIVPHIANLRGRDARYVIADERGLRVTWETQTATLHADINLSNGAAAGFTETLPGRLLFATHGDVYEYGIAPAWSVRWSIA